MILTTTHGQTGLPRYFSNVFDALKTMKRGRIDIILPDGRHFRADRAGSDDPEAHREFGE